MRSVGSARAPPHASRIARTISSGNLGPRGKFLEGLIGQRTEALIARLLHELEVHRAVPECLADPLEAHATLVERTDDGDPPDVGRAKARRVRVDRGKDPERDKTIDVCLIHAGSSPRAQRRCRSESSSKPSVPSRGEDARQRSDGIALERPRVRGDVPLKIRRSSAGCAYRGAGSSVRPAPRRSPRR